MSQRSNLKSQINDFKVFGQNLNQLPSANKILIQTVNQYSYCLSKEDPEFRASLLGADVLLPDGIGIVIANWLFGRPSIKKIAGADLHQHLLKELNKTGGKCFYLGSTEQTLESIKSRSIIEYKNIEVGYYSPPFKLTFTDSETKVMIDTVNDFKPDLLFIGMTAPKQEKWAFANKESLNAPVISSIGAVFDFYAGKFERPGKIWINLGLEWLVRFAKEPKRMWIRYGYYGPIFIKDLFLEFLSIHFTKKQGEGRFTKIEIPLSEIGQGKY